MSFQQGPLDACGGTLKCASITNCTIDMTSKPIVNVGNPVQPGDAATKQYVDERLFYQSNTIPITLTGMQPVQINDSIRHGAYRVAVMGENEHQPCAIFEICKASFDSVKQSRFTICNNSILGATEQEPTTRIILTWNQNEFMHIAKTSNECDGTYFVRIN